MCLKRNKGLPWLGHGGPGGDCEEVERSGETMKYEISVILFKSNGGWEGLIKLFIKQPSEMLPRTGVVASPSPSVWATLSDLLPKYAQAEAVNLIYGGTSENSAAPPQPGARAPMNTSCSSQTR